MSNDISKQIHSLNKHLSSVGPAVQAAHHLGTSPVAASGIVVVALFVSFMLFFNIGTGVIYTIVGFAYPTFATYKLLQASADVTSCQACMTYWAVLGLFVLLEGVVDLALGWVPLYSIARVAFQTWLFSRDFAGAALVYRTAFVPIISKVDGIVDLIAKELAIPAQKASQK